MAQQISEGKCYLCEGTSSKAEMTTHLESCKEGKAASETPSGDQKPQKTKHLHLVIEGRYLPDYWMHIEASADATLDDLDDFLRDIWLECCGHLSTFTIEEETYFSHPDYELGDQGMDIALSDVLRPQTTFYHEYDFGTTTHLTLKVFSEAEAEGRRESFQILARNDPPSITCGVCEKIATLVCAGCIWEDEGRVCAECAEEHECGEDMLLPVVNSPRVGMCGYIGEGWGSEE